MKSMTGFGRGSFRSNGSSYGFELRSYNNRFLDLKVRLPWTSGELEQRILGALRVSVARGRIDLSMWEERTGAGSRSGGQLLLNEGVALDLNKALRELARLTKVDLPTAASLIPPVKDLLEVQAPVPDIEETWPAMEKGLEEAVAQLIEMRTREGGSLAEDLKRHLQRIQRLCEKIGALTRGEPGRRQQLLAERLEALARSGDFSLDPARLAQEAAHLADRCDVNEELIRLESHLEQLLSTFEEPDPVGRKIEFLLQEVHRELNTIASKTHDAEVSQHVVEAKAQVEKMREQAQNVE